MEHQATPTGYLTRLSPGHLLPDVLRDLGVEPKAVFDAARVDIGLFAEPEAMVSLADLVRVVGLSVQASGRPDLGLLIATRAGELDFGLLGRIVGSAADLRSALHDLVRYTHLSVRGSVATLTVANGVAILQFALGAPFGVASSVSEDTMLGRYFRMIQALLGGTWRPSTVMLAHAPPPERASYRQFFGAPVRFNALRTALEFPADDLERPTVSGASARRAELEAAADIASARLAIGFEERVRWLIRARISEPGLSIEHVAAATGVSRRTLNRRLAVRGATFARLLRSARFATARQLLAESATPLSGVAAAIGYAEPSVFSNAFRAWSGMSPRKWRRLHGREWDGAATRNRSKT
jgi:AraC-like DNA-binding protein